MARKIGIVEICEPNHYSAVNGLMKTYASDPDNKVYVFTIPKIAKALVENGLLPNIELIEKDEKTSAGEFLRGLENYSLDRLHVCTIYGDYKAFVNLGLRHKEIFTHIHGIDVWFSDSIARAWKIMVFDLKNKSGNRKYHRIIGRFFREAFFNSRYRRAYLRNVRNTRNHYIVHSKGQFETLSRFLPEEKITVFPFAIFEGMEGNASQNTRLRVCVPGVITQARRDYVTLFEEITRKKEQFKDRITLDLLGFVPEPERSTMVPLIEKVQKAGIEVLYYHDFVFGKQYDDLLNSADILLNNQKVELDPTAKYGVTKESGMIFNMLRGAKPGILPVAYQVNDEYLPSTLFYKDYIHLIEILLDLIDNPVKICNLKANAVSLSEQHLPTRLYKRLAIFADAG